MSIKLFSLYLIIGFFVIEAVAQQYPIDTVKTFILFVILFWGPAMATIKRAKDNEKS